jgi:hypothetical protein
LSACEIKCICDYLASPNGSVGIEGNAIGCNSLQEVEDACDSLTVGDLTIDEGFSIHPNPASTQITLETYTTPQKNTFLTIFNINGQQLKSRQITEPQTVVDVSGLPQGIYFVRVKDDKTVQVGKIIRQ